MAIKPAPNHPYLLPPQSSPLILMGWSSRTLKKNTIFRGEALLFDSLKEDTVGG
jgi:hypothetical protein